MSSNTVPAPAPVEPHPRWPAALSLFAIGGIYLALPEHLTMGPNWLLPVVLAAFVILLIATHHWGHTDLNHALGISVGILTTIALIWSVGALIVTLSHHPQSGAQLLVSAGALWFCNVLVFANWYWRLDAGGPHARDQRGAHSEGAFLFPQMTLASYRHRWSPGFVDYLFLAFNTSTAFSPTDVAPLSRWAKLLMMAQATISLGAVVVLAGRAVNMF